MENQSNGTISGRLVRKACDEALKEIGPGATYEVILSVLRGKGLSLTEQTYEKRFREIHGGPVSEPVSETTPEVLSGGQGIPAGQRMDLLSDFIRFAGIVEQIGGIAKAKRFIEALEKLGDSLK